MRPLLSLLLLSPLASPPLARAALEEIGISARSMGMGDSLTADSEGLSGLALNPATLGHLQRWELQYGMRRIFDIPAGKTDINGMSFGAAGPLDSYKVPGAIGLSWTHDNISPIALDRTLGLTYATKSWRELGPGVFDIGTTLKVLKRGGRDLGGSFSKVSMDLGTFYRWGERHAAGLSVLNITSPKTTLDTPAGRFPDRAPVIMKAGFVERLRQFMVSFDLSRRGPSGSFGTTTSAAMGVEHGWGTAKHGSFTGRSGLILSTRARSWSLGGGWTFLGTHLDYGLRIPLSGGSRWSHMVSLSYRFGQWNPEAEYERLLSDEFRYREDLTKALETAEIKQWKLAEEMRLLRGEMEDLKKELSIESARTGQAKERLKASEKLLHLKEMEEKRRQADVRLRQLEVEHKRLREADRERRLQEEMEGYEALRSRGVSDILLIDRLKKILLEFKGQEVDLGPAQKELRRLLAQ